MPPWEDLGGVMNGRLVVGQPLRQENYAQQDIRSIGGCHRDEIESHGLEDRDLAQRLAISYILLVGVFGCGGTHQADAQSSRLQAEKLRATDVGAGASLAELPIYDLVALERNGAFDDIPMTVIGTDNDPAYNVGRKDFKGYDLGAVLERLPGFHSLDPKVHMLRFVCLDGYHTVFGLETLRGAKGLLAKGVVVEGRLQWPTYLQGKTKKTPAPFYIVWANQPVDKMRPWPYQLTRIEAIRREAIHGSGGVSNGAKVFQEQCSACHSINLEGGVLGPELNVPKNICEYRTMAYLSDFIYSPQSYRAGSTMPPMSHLKRSEISEVIEYICDAKVRKVCNEPKACAALVKESR